MERGVVIGLLGLGTVGSGVVQIVKNHQQELQHKVGCQVSVGKILVRDKSKHRDLDIDEDQLTVEVEDVVHNPDIDVVIEVMGGVNQAREYIIQALQNKKHVVTANKDLMALYGAELLSVAAENGCDLFYEASVAGGIPVLRGMAEGLASDRITQMMGIVNGTTNYILTKMEQDGRDYEDVLREAQELGFAESDPTADVEGLDAARKIAILANLGFSMNVELEDVLVRGITTITTEDMEYCKQLGYSLKLIGLASRTEGRVELTVQPMLLPHSHPLASVQDEYNAVYVYGEAVGETMFYGPGAGSLPTATAVVSDLVTVVKNLRLGVNGQMTARPLYDKQLKTDKEVESKYFMRLQVRDETGTFDTLTALFAKEDVSFERLLQWPLENEKEPMAEVVLITHETNRAVYEKIYRELENMDVVLNVKSSYRVEGGQA
ncbi:homoserine dehydrogenase [Alteribacillus persepolensis]|uniref:Homoserine dehydrogenase n=1 Tax=Alteribacillus persepolensis TaxID=568899 RepID=A0A1G8DY52_9BACI|nr:homoserine dehydrogenase [Alteribacillus persepolensis]SDH62481.1 homoserine dehydrogenase [Alteribacillus persepolensis]